MVQNVWKFHMAIVWMTMQNNFNTFWYSRWCTTKCWVNLSHTGCTCVSISSCETALMLKCIKIHFKIIKDKISGVSVSTLWKSKMIMKVEDDHKFHENNELATLMIPKLGQLLRYFVSSSPWFWVFAHNPTFSWDPTDISVWQQYHHKDHEKMVYRKSSGLRGCECFVLICIFWGKVIIKTISLWI